MSEARERILGRIRQALKSPTSSPHWLDEPVQSGPIFPLPARDEASLLERFKGELEAIHGELFLAADLDEGRRMVTALRERWGYRKLLALDQPSLRRFAGSGDDWNWLAGGNPTEWESADLGVTPVESLVAESGTVVISAATAGRAASVLPPAHLAIATADQLAPDLETAFERLRRQYGAALPSSASFISGPSRTADIEKILVLGAHGPRRLIVLVLPTGSLD